MRTETNVVHNKGLRDSKQRSEGKGDLCPTKGRIRRERTIAPSNGNNIEYASNIMLKFIRWYVSENI